MRHLFLAVGAALALSACAPGLVPVEDGGLEPWMEEEPLDIPIDREYLKPLLQVVPDDVRSIGYDSYGPTSSVSRATEVWEVTGRWYHITSEAGMAWPENSGLTWDEKYSAWVDSMDKTVGDNGYMTVELTTPWGKTLPSPALECAEMGMFLRAVFASWYELPFFLSAWHPTYGTLYYGNFGIVTSSGARVSGTPTFRSSYKDYTDDFANANDGFIVDNWPQDASLRAKALTTMKDDEVEFLGEGAYAGAYFDEVVLNKRVGHFLLRLLTNFGSMHLASAKNTFNLEPEAVRPGDLLIERWQSNGIGHVMVVKEVEELSGDKMNAEVMFGSMPRIQLKWYGPNISKSYFTDEMTGGAAESGEGVPYSHLGGGLKRWRTPVVKGGRWVNIVPVKDREEWIGSTDYTRLGERPGEFKLMLGQLTPDEEREVIVERIEIQRDNLLQHPASCASRIRREEAFDDLYTLMSTHFGMSRAQVDEQYRAVGDYVFAELEYDQSKTCCWNSTTPEMAQLILDFNQELIEDAQAAGECPDLAVFKARNGDYAVFRDYAVSRGMGAQWVAWSEDESCPQRNVQNDAEATHDWSDFCDVMDAVAGQGPGGDTGGSTGGDTGTGGPDGCGELTYDGECDGNTVRWCDQGQVYEYSCTGTQTCGWDDYYDYYWCL